MNIAQIENNLQKLVISVNKETFIYDLLLAYGQPKASITRLQKGGLNLSKVDGEISWKKKLFFKPLQDEDLHETIEEFKTDIKIIKYDPRFLVVTDYKTILAIDRKTSETLDIPILEITKHFDFFLPWAGMEKAHTQLENLADVKAAERLAKLYDEIRKDNPTKTPEEIHNLNVFLSRLLFCFFAEDTDIFEKNLFTNSISSHTQVDGSDLNSYLDKLFEVMNTETTSRKGLPAYLDSFPYVNGGLFKNKHKAPIFTRRSRQAIIESGELNWSEINPDIFGSMMQAVITPEHRGGLGMHYTSVPNIMKVIEPLFLNDFYDEFESAKYEPRKLNKLLDRIGKVKIFDPACGSGNFLIIAYKELCTLEIKILQQLQTLQEYATGFEEQQIELIPKAQLTLASSFQASMFSRIELSQFYGIELDDFAHEIAILSLWLAQHQMNMKFKKMFGTANPTLPLKSIGNIVRGNATRLDWKTVCPIKQSAGIYILGNPPYLGGKRLSKQQSLDMNFAGLSEMKQLDYIGCWFIKASNFIKEGECKFSFVSTSSICEGEQVYLLWNFIFSNDQEIEFAYSPFPWSNNAKYNAGVICTILGINNKKSITKKILYNNGRAKYVQSISPYLIEAKPILIIPRSTPLSDLPIMTMGSNPVDGTNLVINENEYSSLIKKFPEIKKFIRRYMGGNDLLKNEKRYCLWIDENQIKEAEKNPFILERILKCQKYRVTAGRDARKMAHKPYRFCYKTHQDKPAIIFPKTTSSNRKFVPLGITDKNTIINVDAFAVYNIQLHIFGILSSRLHNIWLSISSGKLGSGFRYSVKLSYNTFPFPHINDEQEQSIKLTVLRVLEEREHYSEKTLAQLYDPDEMPESLREVHHQLDLAVERCYRSRPFENDEERLEYLFKLYEQMITEEKAAKGEFSFDQPKIKKKRR